MKKTLISLAAAGMLASTVAAAQTYGQPYYRDDAQRYVQNDRYDDRAARWDDRSATINEREARINAFIQRGMSDGRINDREARRLHRELRDIEAKERSYMNDGHLNRRETESLNRDLDRLVDHVRQQMRD